MRISLYNTGISTNREKSRCTVNKDRGVAWSDKYAHGSIWFFKSFLVFLPNITTNHAITYINLRQRRL